MDDIYDLGKQPADQLPEALHEIIEFSILASEKDPFDPMEKAFKELGERYLNAYRAPPPGLGSRG